MTTAVAPLVVSRKEIRTLLQCSDAIIRQLERRGRLTPIQLGAGKRGVRYRRGEVLRLVGDGTEA